MLTYRICAAVVMALISFPRVLGQEVPHASSSVFTEAHRQELISKANRLKADDLPALDLKAQSGDLEAQIVLASAYRDGIGVGKDYAKAIAWLRKAAEGGHPMAQNALGLMYVNGWGVERSAMEAFKLFQSAAEQNYGAGEANLGWMYFAGDGVGRDAFKAVELFRKAAEQGNVNGMNRLGIAYFKGEGAPRDDAQAVSWYGKAAEAGDVLAQHNVAQMYNYGQGVKKDYAEAAAWYRKAAEQGYSRAQFDLAIAFYNGEGVPKDKQEAAKWMGKASEMGAADATFYLGRMYLNGDLGHSMLMRRLSMEKFQIAAEQGYPLGAMQLGFIYASWIGSRLETGSGRDYKQACRWLYIAEDLHNRHEWDRTHPPDSSEVERELPGKLTKIQKELSPDDLKTCRSEATEWTRLHLKTP